MWFVFFFVWFFVFFKQKTAYEMRMSDWSSDVCSSDLIETLKTDSALLTSILTYHVVPGQVAPDDIAGTHTTVQGGDVEVTGSGDMLMVKDARSEERSVG